MKYTPAEIDRMRAAVAYIYQRDHPPPGHAMSFGDLSHMSTQRSLVCERRLLTYMANETTADELEEHAAG